VNTRRSWNLATLQQPQRSASRFALYAQKSSLLKGSKKPIAVRLVFSLLAIEGMFHGIVLLLKKRPRRDQATHPNRRGFMFLPKGRKTLPAFCGG
jgi:hypothetical protein